MPIAKLAEQCKEHQNTIMRIVKKYVDQSRGKANYSAVENVCIDETASKRGHSYITSLVNADTKKVCGIVI